MDRDINKKIEIKLAIYSFQSRTFRATLSTHAGPITKQHALVILPHKMSPKNQSKIIHNIIN